MKTILVLFAVLFLISAQQPSQFEYVNAGEEEMEEPMV